MGFWKNRQLRDVQREADIESARTALASSMSEHRAVLDQGPEVASLSSFLAERRDLNHFGDSLAVSFTPRSRNA